ncbi:hypothetical protein NPIL_86361 [Nephila pilipes]|uniref:Uncharacterized protein n=1 Tax=Nephila pilipes TaxID=299642 RepID=A0A8X6NDT0_NEPPI|nr:hypothetical protein NPIL_86361 [Nephila pilipes]
MALLALRATLNLLRVLQTLEIKPFTSKINENYTLLKHMNAPRSCRWRCSKAKQKFTHKVRLISQKPPESNHHNTIDKEIPNPLTYFSSLVDL